MLLKGKPPVVDVKLDALPYDTIRTQITQIADTNLKVSPKRLSSKAGGPLATTTDPNTGVEKLRDNSYQARAPIDDDEAVLRLGLRGTGRVYTAWQPLGTRLWRLVKHTFHFKM